MKIRDIRTATASGGLAGNEARVSGRLHAPHEPCKPDLQPEP